MNTVIEQTDDARLHTDRCQPKPKERASLAAHHIGATEVYHAATITTSLTFWLVHLRYEA